MPAPNLKGVQTMTDTVSKTYQVTVIERALAYYKVEAEDARTAAENWQDGDFYDRDDEALDTEGPCSVRERQPDGSWLNVPRSEWEPEPPAASDPAKKPYSVLLLYPDYVGNYGEETYYAFVEAADPIEAVTVAQRQAVAAETVDIDDPDDFAPLLVTAGHHASEPHFNK
jgi:hypothetical protein